MTYKCLIAEDDLLERDMLAMLLGKIEQAEIVAVCEDGLSAMQYLMAHEVDIVFSDVDMPQLSGMALLASLRRPPVFVFISAYSEYAAKGFDLDVVDFIVKPVTPQRLYKAFAKAGDYLDRQTFAAVAPPVQDVIFARTSEGLLKIALQDIMYAESRANFSMLHLQDGNKHLLLVNLKGLAEQLPAGRFIRIHKYFLINWGLITIVHKDSIVVGGNQELPIGDTYKKAIADRLVNVQVIERNPGTHPE